MTGAVAAVDLGGSSGRVMLGHVGRDELEVVEVARFPNEPVRTPDGLHWDVLGLYRHAIAGLAEAHRREPELRSIGVDSWAVDYALMRGGRLLGDPFAYRDERTDAAVARVHARVAFPELYRRNGLQFLPFTTIYQLEADRASGRLEPADGLLLIPDLLNHWLTGEIRAERTNASTTGLLDVRSRDWDLDLARSLAIPGGILPPLIDAGSVVGALTPDAAAMLGTSRPIEVTAVGSHDTASAVVALPVTSDNVAYVSSGTWSLVGVELDAANVSDESRAAGFTNEGGVDGRTRFLKNVSGLWLLSECVRIWGPVEGTSAADLPRLLDEAARLPAPDDLFDVADPVFVPPGDMPSRIADWYRNRGLRPPATQAQVVRAILESLADAYARVVDQAVELTGKRVDAIHIVGGGSRNALLCRLTAAHSGRPVVAGPAEATAIGNAIVQARAQGLISGSLEALRALVARTVPTTTHRPVGAAIRHGASRREGARRD